MNAPIRIKDPNASSRLYSFNLTFGGMAVLMTSMTLALTLFFVLGVLVGRGHRPEAAVPAVANMMPKENLGGQAPPPEVLKTEDLNYPEQLSEKSGKPAPSRPIDKVVAKAPDKAVDSKDEKKSEKKDEKQAAKPEKIAAKSPDKKDIKKDAKKDEKKPDPDTQRYDYAYQVATFPDAESAKAYLKRIKGMGLKGDIESGTTNGKDWHRVVVFFQGTPTDTRALKEKLGALGAQKLVMRSKTAI
ncbi:MAG: SPOR domain-containing protein [Humidesulfovibrio sp.]|nr:SPOR domain-containing protein [Humidesulfovibrio sp.]